MVKKFLLSLIAVCLMIGPVHAATVTATFGDMNSSSESRIKADTDGTVTYAADTSIVYPYKTYNNGSLSTTGPVSLAITDSGRTITDFGGKSAGSSVAGWGLKYVLPACSSSTLGATYSFATATKSTITVDTASTSDTIGYSISGTALDAGDSIKSTGQAGDAVTVVCAASGVWSITNMKATWTDNSTN